MNENKKNISVVLKVRPLIKREKDSGLMKQWDINGETIECTNIRVPNSRYTFDKIYGEHSTNLELYENEAKPIVEQVVKGYNGTIFAYGQTSSGKTFTMLGDKQNPGVIRLAARQIFNEISKAEEGRSYVIRVRYLEIYNEKVYVLLNSRSELKIKELPNGDLNVGGGQLVRSEDQILQLVDDGNLFRTVAETNMNMQSSRSHAILQIEIQSVKSGDHPALVSLLNLVDLAGSERAEENVAIGERLKEASNINKSLLTLGIVIGKLADEPDSHIGYRNSKLTRMLQNSLGGNSMTVMICAITPVALEETNRTLGFAMRAKKIENKPIVNEVVSDAVQVKRMRKKIASLENELETHKKQMFELEKFTIRASPAILTTTDTLRRRRTWGGQQSTTEIPKPSFIKPPTFGMANNSVDKPLDTKLLSDRGCGSFEPFGDEFDEEEWQKGSLFKMQSIDENGESTSTSSTVASPIALDKDRRIRALEDELEKLRHFHQTETHTAESLQASLDDKLEEITNLNEQIDEARAAVAELTVQLKEANTERSSAVKAKVLAEQQFTSIEFEYEQHKVRASLREKELVEQLENLGNDDTVKILKDKLNAMTEKVNSLETQIWQDEKKHKSDLDAIKATVTAEKEKNNKLTNQLTALKNHQSEYDEVSSQLVDAIQENDELKRKYKILDASVNDLNAKVTDLEVQLAMKTSLGEQSDELQAKLQQQNIDHATGLQTLKENYDKKIVELEKKNASMTDEIKILKEECKSNNEEKISLQNEFEQLSKQLEVQGWADNDFFR